MRGNALRWLVALACGAGIAPSAHAQAYPTKMVRIIAPYAPGGSVDLIARLLAQKLQDRFGQPVVVDNRPGAGGAIGVDMTAKSAPDGYTVVLVGNGAVTVSPLINRVQYDPVKDLAPVSMLVTLPLVVSVNAALPVRTIAELIDYAKAKPGTVNYSSSGLGSNSFLAAELFKKTAGIDMLHVPYKGAAPGATAVASGEVQVGVMDANGIMPQVRAGMVRVLAITNPKRSALMPDYPTVAESGLPGFGVTSWIAMFAPAKTPAAVIARLNAAVGEVLQQADVRERMLKMDMEPLASTPEELGRQVRTDLQRWEPIVKAAGLKTE